MTKNKEKVPYWMISLLGFTILAVLSPEPPMLFVSILGIGYNLFRIYSVLLNEMGSLKRMARLGYPD
jgi:hypothetical protein